MQGRLADSGGPGPVLFQDIPEAAAMRRLDVGQNDVLVTNETEFVSVEGGNFNQCGFEAAAGQIVNAAAFDEQREIRLSLDIARPAEGVAEAFEVVGVCEVVVEVSPWANGHIERVNCTLKTPR